MKIAGKRSVAAPHTAIEKVLANGQRWATAVPHFQLLSPLSDGQWRGVVRVAVGPLQGDYEGTFAFDRPEDGVFAVTFEGHSARGVFRGHGRIQLEAQNEHTIIHYEGDIAVAGHLAAVPPRLLQANVNALARRTLETIDHLLWPEKFAAAAPPTGSKQRSTAVIGSILALIGGLLLIYYVRREKQHQETTP